MRYDSSMSHSYLPDVVYTMYSSTIRIVWLRKYFDNEDDKKCDSNGNAMKVIQEKKIKNHVRVILRQERQVC